MIYFDALTQADCEQIRKWRNEDISAARTPFLLTDIMQKDFYEKVISNRDSEHRYWAIRDLGDNYDTKCGFCGGLIDNITKRCDYNLCGIAGLTNIEWENGRAEIALMIAPHLRKNHYGKDAIGILKKWGFGRMRLHTIYACVYGNNHYLVQWWKGLNADEVTSYPGGKFYDHAYHPTHHFTWVNQPDTMFTVSTENK